MRSAIQKAWRFGRESLANIHDDGFRTFVGKASMYAFEEVRAQTTGRAGDWLVRRLLDDPYTLPQRLRYGTYLDRKRHAAWTYQSISSHTEIDFADNLHPEFTDQYNTFDGFRIADIGCGDGNLAAEFIEHHPEIQFIGVDVKYKNINALNRRFRGSNYRFVHVDVANDQYNPNGELSPEEFEFPFDSGYFDLVIIHSVFTHMRPATIRNYLAELSRILDDDGIAWTTWFLSEDSQHSQSSNSVYDFKYEFDEFRSIDPNIPEAAICYEYDIVEDFIEDTNLEIRRQRDGWWSGDKEDSAVDDALQDVVLFSK